MQPSTHSDRNRIQNTSAHVESTHQKNEVYSLELNKLIGQMQLNEQTAHKPQSSRIPGGIPSALEGLPSGAHKPRMHAHAQMRPHANRAAPAPQLHSQAPLQAPSHSQSHPRSTVFVAPQAPEYNQTVRVSLSLLPQECPIGRTLVLGLYRVGQLTNERPFFVKQLFLEQKRQLMHSLIIISITCRAPRCAGNFEFRVVEQFDSKQDANRQRNAREVVREDGKSYSDTTFATSNMMHVKMEDSDFKKSLLSTETKLQQSVNDGDSQLLLGTFTLFQRLLDRVDHPKLQKHDILSVVLGQFMSLILWDQSKLEECFESTDSIPRPMEAFHSAMWNILQCVERNPMLQSFLSPTVTHNTAALTSRYCPVTGLFFTDIASRMKYWKAKLDLPLIDFQQHRIENIVVSPLITSRVSDWIERQASFLIPDREEFWKTRGSICDIINTYVVQKLGMDAKLYVFGSSANDFGMNESDLDLCLLMPNYELMTHAEKRQVLTQVVTLMKDCDLFQDIDTRRLGARVPIVMFKVSVFDIECDLCMENALAHRNTALLRAYANADPRVRKLAYIIKHFVKRRRMNCAAERTLSSYGYLLMLIHFLQQQEPPILPNMQTLPESWDGNPRCGCKRSTRRCPWRSPHCDLTERLDEMNLPSVRSYKSSTDRSKGSYVDLIPVETYFYNPFAKNADTSARIRLLEAFGSRNGATVGELFTRFLFYFGLQFDSSRMVVSIRMGRTLLKTEKYSQDSPYWRFHSRLSIEDPFETSYDVAHVLKETRHFYIRQQFTRAYVKLAEAAIQTDLSEDFDDLMGRIVEQVDTFPFQMKQNAQLDDLRGEAVGRLI
ncbi:unnamed protein product [Albugo candida]|uniref:Uncharacterized protein n=1 Tax=Albugo candida TaxID=65357 RepID=A0A024G3L1_9STRA|nr:unnamed protein product [Albugo candida]|eukprot:CCI41413.1 unnamed protein product [Albugo candida]